MYEHLVAYLENIQLVKIHHDESESEAVTEIRIFNVK